MDLQKPDSDPNLLLPVVMCTAFHNAVVCSVYFAVALHPVFQMHIVSTNNVTAVCVYRVRCKFQLEWTDNCEGCKNFVRV